MRFTLFCFTIIIFLSACKDKVEDIEPLIIEDEKSSIVVTIENIIEIEGQMVVALYSNETDWETDVPNRSTGHEYEVQRVEVDADKMTFTYKDIVAGDYGVTLYQDINSNNEVDLLAGLLPTEPYGFSNNFTPTFSAPAFSDVSFIIEDMQQLEITISLIQP